MTIGCSVRPPAFRPLIDGTVIRFPGTGEGVARLVSVSIVTFDIDGLLGCRWAAAKPAPHSAHRKQQEQMTVFGRLAIKCGVFAP